MRIRLALLVLAVVVPPILEGCANSTSTTPSPITTASTASPIPSSPSSSASSTSTHPPSPSSAKSGVASQSAVPAEHNPPGDIPDNLAFVAYSNRSGGYRFTHPEGWAEIEKGATASFTDKLNGVTAETGALTAAPSVSSAQAQDVPALKSGQPAFELRSVTAVTEPGGKGVRIVYRRNSASDPVTGRQYRDEVERYELVNNGHEVVLELYGPVGADNVDAYRTMVQSLRIA